MAPGGGPAQEFSLIVEKSLKNPETSSTRFAAVRSWLANRIGATPDLLNVSYISRGSANFKNRFGQQGFAEATDLGIAILDDPKHTVDAVSFVKEWLKAGKLIGPIAIGSKGEDGDWALTDLVEIAPSTVTASLRGLFPELHVNLASPATKGSVYPEGSHPAIWMEITGHEVGKRLIAPLTKDHWAYPLMDRVREGDLIVHYSTGRQAIVGVSRASGGVAEAELVWGSKNSKDADTPRPARTIPLADYRELSTPVTLDDIRSKDDEIRAIHDKAAEGTSEPPFFPFIWHVEGIRPQQAYFTRFPAEIAQLFEPLRDVLGGVPGGRGPEGSKAETLVELAARLFLPAAFLERIRDLLLHRRQVILYGPPGTGKTYVARELARHMARDADAVRLVQFHPSYSYEDFVEGFRPVPGEGGGGFALRDGPLKKTASQARNTPAGLSFLLIDEVNRGNVAKIFGELYFLLEYREEQILLQYSEAPFALPKNLLIIGTMNSVDRSIALVDAALRRRFHFVPFFPDRPPISEVLALWLKAKRPHLLWVAELVRLANELVGNRQGLIGPSHFLREDLTEEWVELIWDHSVKPYLEEQFFGDEARLEEFEFKKLSLKAKSPKPAGPEASEKTH